MGYKVIYSRHESTRRSKLLSRSSRLIAGVHLLPKSRTFHPLFRGQDTPDKKTTCGCSTLRRSPPYLPASSLYPSRKFTSFGDQHNKAGFHISQHTWPIPDQDWTLRNPSQSMISKSLHKQNRSLISYSFDSKRLPPQLVL